MRSRSQRAVETAIRNGVTFGGGGLLAIVFTGLKLSHVIAWPWIWVLSPLWIPFGGVAVYAVLVMVVALIVAAVKG